MFRETLRYASPQKPGTTARYDGNISEITYTSYNGTSTPSTDTYGYAYDGLKRLTDAVHYAGNAASPVNTKTERNITYDRGGNITGLDRYGAAGLSEMLSFTHAGNRLTSMQGWDGANLPQIGTFTYDAMGNQLTDSRKGLQFSYNLANLPSKVEGSAGSGNAGLTLNYGYLSDGTKTSSLAGTGSSAEGLKYRGAFVYELKDGAERLSSVGWSEGRTEYVYAPSLVEDGDEVLEGPEELLEIDDLWYVADHLGNTRAVVNMSGGGTVLEQNEYLPFGTRLDGTLALPENRYRLGGKEEQRFGGLDLALSDFGARFYDPFTCRWTTRDPMAGKYHSWSPYNYCAGNPVNYVDPDGKKIKPKGSKEFVKKVYAAINTLSAAGVDDFINILSESTYTYEIIEGSRSKYDGNNRRIIWDPNHMQYDKDKTIMRSTNVTLNHEFDHAAQHETNKNQYFKDAQPNNTQFSTHSDEMIIKGSEQTTARALGEISDNQVTRSSHEGRRGPNVSNLSAENQSKLAAFYNQRLEVIKNPPYDIAH